MRIFVLPKDFKGSTHHTVTGKDAHYLSRVLRLKEGDSFTGRDVKGSLWNLTLESISKSNCTLTCEPAETEPFALTDALPAFKGPFPEIHLYQAICKGKKMDQIIRQATELGVKRIIPVSSAYCVADFSGKEQEKTTRYQTIVKEALQQSGSPVVTEIASPLSIGQVAQDWAARGTALVFHQVETGKQESLSSILHDSQDSPVALLVGAEGGFSNQEVSLLIEQGFHPVLLKTNILRAETAAIAAVAIVLHLVIDNV